MTATTRAVFIHAEAFKQKFKESTCVLPISVGQPYHENMKFEWTIQLVNQHFKECFIMICDSLQRHTLSLKYPLHQEAQLHQKSIEAGDFWWERNKKTIDKLKIPYQLMRWDQWLSTPTYKKNRVLIDKWYQNDFELRQIMNHTISKFLIRAQEKNTFGLKADQLFHICLEYTKEEMSIMPLWVEKNIHFEVYPGPRSSAMRAAHDRLVKPFHQHLL